MVPKPSASASPENLLEMQILRPHPSPAKIESAEGGGPQSVLEQALQAVLMYLRSEKHCSGEEVGETDGNRQKQTDSSETYYCFFF